MRPDTPSTTDTLSQTVRIAAPAERIFAVLTDPTTHPAIDGTGWLTGAVDAAPLTASGQVFRMDMFHQNHPDGSYQMSNQVIACDPPHAVAWKPGQPGPDGTLGFGGWTWRYELEPVGAETDVTLTYDWSQVPPQVREQIGFPPFPPEHLDSSLRHLAELVG